ncbi:hypothetical protein HPB47_014929 [Ixodes persulcatus]|uniref:Uncharacterized protein n=1 Tax=Ixodes persulcatus TaxID=34615 RepID=A0AC60QUS2_IXOPE|nr:hypothetical protein HPB47_014929 [Ixodes persulcatus]
MGKWTAQEPRPPELRKQACLPAWEGRSCENLTRGRDQNLTGGWQMYLGGIQPRPSALPPSALQKLHEDHAAPWLLAVSPERDRADCTGTAGAGLSWDVGAAGEPPPRREGARCPWKGFGVLRAAARSSSKTWVALDSIRGAGPRRATSAYEPCARNDQRFLASRTPVYGKRGPKWCIASPGGPRRVQTYPGFGSTTRMPFSPDTGKPRTARRGYVGQPEPPQFQCPILDDEDLHSKKCRQLFRAQREAIRPLELAEASAICSATVGQRRNPSWKRERVGGITVSNFRRVVHCQQPESLVRDILYPQNVKLKPGDPRLYGIENEGKAVQQYLELMTSYYDKEIRVEETGLHVYPEYPSIGASPDRIEYDGEEVGVLERKTLTKLSVLSPAASTSHRIDTRFYTPEENAQRSERASDVKRDIENKSATQRKFDLLDANFADVDRGMLKDRSSHFIGCVWT